MARVSHPRPWPEKMVIARDAANQSDTDHLLPVLAFLLAQGYEMATDDRFYFDRDGLGTYGFTQPLDVELLRAHFDFPASIKLADCQLFDRRHFLRICQDDGPQAVRCLSFEP